MSSKIQSDELLDYGSGAINILSTKYIVKYVDKFFLSTYWIEHTHGSTDYDEMLKLIRYIVGQQLFCYHPLALGNEKYTKPYNSMRHTLGKTSDYALNIGYIETFEIDLNEIKKDTFEMLKHYIKNYTETKGEK